jgi:phosphoglycolate phosphatase
MTHPITRPKRAVVFDLDGTLIDSYQAIAASLNVSRNHFGLPELELDEVRRMVGWGLEVLMERSLGPVRVAEGVRLFREHYARVYEQLTRLLPGAEPTLRELAARGYPLAVATNKPENFSRSLLHSLGVGDYVSSVHGARDGVRLKPEPDLLLEAVEALGVTRAEALYVGDMHVDVETASRAGVEVLLVPTGSTGPQELRRHHGPRVLAGLDRLLGILPPLKP